MPPVTVQYDLTLEDMVALAQYHSDRAPRERRRRRLVQGLIVAVFLFLLYTAIDSIRRQGADLSPGWIAMSGAPLICPAILLVLVFSTGVRRWSNSRSVYKAFGPREPGSVVASQQLTVAEDGIHVRSGAGEIAIGWAEVTDITRSNSHLFVLGAAEQAIVLPRRSFPDATAFDAVVDAATERWVQARQATTSQA